jgi:hypothetical protein
MPEPLPAEVVLWQQLGRHLKTEVEVSKPETVSDYRYSKKQIEVIHFKVRFSNTAPDEPDWPKIVFTGVGLAMVPLSSRDAHPFPRKWEKFDVKIEKPDRRLQSHGIFGVQGTGFRGTTVAIPWEDLTTDESKHGIALFPGDSATLELTIPVDDISKYELHVEGGVSRRHFFHYDRIVRIPQA